MANSKLIACRHCGNISRMDIEGNVFVNESWEDPQYGPGPDQGTHYDILKCPACDKINIVTYFTHEYMESEEDISYEFLYPQNSEYPQGLPQNILVSYKAAEKVKSIDVNAYAILMRRLLEQVCIDRGANSGTLATMLTELANKGEIPQKLVKVAAGLKDFGNIGAHAGSGDLSIEEIPIVNALCKAILEYVYSAPYLVDVAETKLKQIKSKRR
jgi:hypothetical protein